MRRTSALGLLGLLVSCGGGGSGGPTTPPPPDRSVASITVTPASPQVDVGGTVLLSATARNAAGEALSGIVFDWQSADASIATVDANGLVTGRAPGPVAIRASSGGRTGSSDLTVQFQIAITAVAPNPIVEGQPVTISGTGFAGLPAGNRVTIGGVEAAVVSASAGQLVVTAPSDCQPPGRTAVRVTVGSRTSPAFDHPLQPSVAAVELPVGVPLRLAPAAGGCLQFPSSPTQEFLVGVQSTAEAVTSLVPLRIRAMAGIPIVGNLVPAGEPGGRGFEAPPLDGLDRLLHRHRQSEFQLREMEIELLGSGRISLAAARANARRGDLRPAATVDVGDRFEVRIPDRAGTNACDDFVTVNVEVRHVGERGVFVEDLENPTGGLTADQYAQLSAIFDGMIHATISEHFGATTDFDGNGRVVIVLSRRLNEWFAATGALGFVLFGNLFPRSDCLSSNVGEIYYSLAPDPLGTFGPPVSAELILDLEKVLLAHEVTHLIQQAGRLMTPGATSLMSAWQAEGQATYAEEIVGFRSHGRSAGNDYGPAVLFEDIPLNWHIDMFTDLVTYFGFESPESRVRGAPEECSFLGLPSQGNSSPCLGRMAYGVSWSFLRWLSDQVGPAGAAALHQRIIRDTGTGFATIENATGRDMEELLALWSASLYVDGRYAGLDPSLLWSSWNLFAIDQAAVQTARLVPRSAGSTDADVQVSVRAGSSAYYLLRGNNASLRVRGAASGSPPPNVQIWAVRVR